MSVCGENRHVKLWRRGVESAVLKVERDHAGRNDGGGDVDDGHALPYAR